MTPLPSDTDLAILALLALILVGIIFQLGMLTQRWWQDKINEWAIRAEFERVFGERE